MKGYKPRLKIPSYQGRTNLLGYDSEHPQANPKPANLQAEIPPSLQPETKRTKGRLTIERLNLFMASYQTYDGDPFEAGSKLGSSPYTLMKYWRKANLPIKRKGAEYHPRLRIPKDKTERIQKNPAPPLQQARAMDIEEIIAQQNPLILRQYRTIQTYLDVKTVFDYVMKYGKPEVIPQNDRKLSPWDLSMEEVSEQRIARIRIPQLEELARSNQQMALALPNFAATPLRLRHDWMFTDSLYMEDYRISLNGGNGSRSILVWKGDKRHFMVDIGLVRTSDYDFGRGIFESIHAYFPGTERLPLSGFHDLEIQGDFHDSTLDDVLHRINRLARVIRRNRVPPLDKPLFVNNEFRDDLMIPY